MSDMSDMPPVPAEPQGENPEKQPLEELREKIDKIDDQILNLLGQRFAIVERVGQLKKPYLEGRSIIRPGREAKMLRRVAKQSGASVPSASVAMIWRQIIAAAISIEEDPVISIYAPANQMECYWLAREYFGAFVQKLVRDTYENVEDDIESGEATVAVLVLNDNRKRPWWVRIAQDAPDVKVFARLPFVKMAPSKRPPVFAMGRVTCEPSGNDSSLWVFEVPVNFTQDMIERFAKEIDPSLFLQGTTQVPGNPPKRLFLYEFNGFFGPDDERMKKLDATLKRFTERDGGSSMSFLGSYAHQMIVS